MLENYVVVEHDGRGPYQQHGPTRAKHNATFYPVGIRPKNRCQSSPRVPSVERPSTFFRFQHYRVYRVSPTEKKHETTHEQKRTPANVGTSPVLLQEYHTFLVTFPHAQPRDTIIMSAAALFGSCPHSSILSRHAASLDY